MVNEKQEKIKDLSDGVPVPVVDVAAQEVRGGRLLALALWLPMMTACGAGSAEPRYQIQGAQRAYTSSGPVDVIVVRRVPQ